LLPTLDLKGGNDIPAPIFWRDFMIKWIIILLVVAAIASLLGMGSLAGAAMTGAKILIGIVLILFLLVIFGIFAIT
jgi:uncharacterized membrane protein YtjA (UPF0391 family)